MAKTKNKKRPKPNYEEEMFDDMDFNYDEPYNESTINEEDSLDPEKDANISDNINIDDNIPENPMSLAYQISKESEQVKNFKELPREVKYSFYDKIEKQEVKHFARTYRDFEYIKKCFDLRKIEDESKFDNKKQVLNIKDRVSLIQYLRDSNREYLINDIEDLPEEELDKLLEHLGLLKANEFMNTIENRKNKVEKVFSDYKEKYNKPEYIDDAGMLGMIEDTSLASMGFKGNASQHSIMTIQAVKNEDIQKVAEEKTKFSFLDSIKRRFG